MRSLVEMVRTKSIILLLCYIAGLFFFIWSILRFFPNVHGNVGHDYSVFIPWLVAGYFWRVANGVLSIPEFIPSFCGAVPFAFNPQSIFFSLPQQLVSWLDPLRSLTVSIIFFGLCGWLATYALLRNVFRTSLQAAIVGATLFLLNGFYSQRMIVGHLTFQGFMLVPAIVLALMPRSASVLQMRETGVRAIIAGLLLAYIFYSGGIYVLSMAPLTIALIVLTGKLLGRWHRSTPVITIGALIVAGGLCAYRLLPALAYTSNVPRPPTLILIGSLRVLLETIIASLFAPEVFHQPPWLERQEFAYGVGAAPLLLILVSLPVILLRRRVASVMAVAGERPLALALLLAALLLPILLSYDRFGMRWLLMHLPVTQSMSVMLRFVSVYIAFLCVLSALLIDFLAGSERARNRWCAAMVGLTLLQWGLTDMRYYSDQPYDPTRLTLAYRAVRDGAANPQIARIGAPSDQVLSRGNDDMTDGESDVPCYEPMFGYLGERFALGRLHNGPVTDVTSGFFNLKNPACYVFPEANDCRPGDEFSVAQSDALERFRH